MGLRGIAALCALVIFPLSACGDDPRLAPQRTELRTTLDELLLQDARTCSSGYTYPQALIDGLSHQLIDELRCLDDRWLEFYEPCKEPGCIWASGPQPHALRPEVIDALYEIGIEANDYISITAGYRDVAMQYFSRWRNENCDPNFNAAIPGASNHQGGRAIDVLYYDYWHDTLLNNGFEFPIPDDEPHFEFFADATFRAESEDLKSLSVVAFQILWNRNNPDDLIDEDGIYGPQTKARLGSSPIEGFPIGGCGVPWEADAGPDADASDVGDDAPDSGGGDGDTGAEQDSGAGHDTGAAQDAGDDPNQPDGAHIPDAASDAAHPEEVDAGHRDTSRPPQAQPPALYQIVQPDDAFSTRGCSAASARNPGGIGGLFFGLALLFAARWRSRSALRA